MNIRSAMNLRSIARRSYALAHFTGRSARLALKPGIGSVNATQLLPPLQGELPAPDGRPMIFAAADPRYFDWFAKRFVESAFRTSGGARLHLHCFEPRLETARALDRWAERHPERFTWTSEHLPSHLGVGRPRVIYYQASRFVRIAQLVEQGHAVLGLDIDCEVRQDLLAATAGAAQADVGLYFRPHQFDPAKRVLAACFLATPTAAGQRFVRHTADMIARHLMLGEPSEKLDQICLYWTYLRRDRALRVWTVPKSLADWHMHPNSAVWMAKGPRKHGPHFSPAAATD
jgi:hypothetical protein